MLWIALGIAIIVGLVMIFGSIRFRKEINQTDPTFITQLLEDRMEDEKVALAVIKNGEEWIKINENIPLPLASTVQVIIAIAFAKQVAEKQIDPDEKVNVKELETFDLPKTDGRALTKWLEAIKKDKPLTEVTLQEIAHGMIRYSVNANTEFLIQRIGLKEINQIPKDVGMNDHDPIYPIVSSLAIPIHLRKNRNITDQQIIMQMKEMKRSEYERMAIDIHEQWIEQPPTPREKRQIAKNLTMPLQRAWSDQLPRSTAEDYVQLMEKLNSKQYFSSEVHHYLDPLLEYEMEKIDNQEHWIHRGEKGGISTSAITFVAYAMDKEQQRYSFAFFAHDLNPMEHVKTSHVLRKFTNKFLSHQEFRTQVKDTLKTKEEIPSENESS